MTKNINKIIKILKRKFRVSLYSYAVLAIVLFSLSAMIIFFNLFAVRMNPAKLTNNNYQKNQLKIEQIIFIIITCLTSFSTFLGGLTALFNFEQKAKNLRNKVKQISFEITNFNTKKGKYEKNQSEELLVNSVNEIILNFEGN